MLRKISLLFPFLIATSCFAAVPVHNDNGHEFMNNVSIYTLGPTVTTSPFIGIRSAFDGNDLIVNLPSMNEDLRILRQRQELTNRLGCLPCANRPLIELSGSINGTVIPYATTFFCTTVSSIELDRARFDILAEASTWAFGYLSMNYDDSALPSTLPGAGSRLKNSNIFLKRGFFTIGNLDCFPGYMTLGQMYVPFGRYSSGIVSSTLTASIGQTNARALLFGAFSHGFFASVYGFRGDIMIDAKRRINNGGVNIGYMFDHKGLSGEVGAGYLVNIADSIGIQCPNTLFGFQGFAFNPLTEIIDHGVPAYDVHFSATYAYFVLRTEFIGTTCAFDPRNLSYNDHGARLSAWNNEFSLRNEYCDRPMQLTFGFGLSCDALVLGLPRTSYVASFSTAIWKNTIESIEYRYDCDYDEGDTASGNGSIPPVITSTGGSRQSVVIQVGVYF